MHRRIPSSLASLVHSAACLELQPPLPAFLDDNNNVLGGGGGLTERETNPRCYARCTCGAHSFSCYFMNAPFFSMVPAG